MDPEQMCDRGLAETDALKKREWWERAAALGHAGAMCNLGVIEQEPGMRSQPVPRRLSRNILYIPPRKRPNGESSVKVGPNFQVSAREKTYFLKKK